MELTLEAVAKDAFRRDFFLRCFTEKEALALELRFAFLHRVRQYKKLVGKRDLLQHAAKDIVASYLQHVESTNQLDLPTSAELLRCHILAAVAAGFCPLDLFNGMETIVREHMTRNAFPQFLCSKSYTELCDALRTRREIPLAEVLVDSRRTQFLMRFLTEKFPKHEGNLRFWVHVQTRFLPIIQTTLFSVALFEEVQRHVRHVFNKFLVGETEGNGSTATRVPEAVRRATLQQIMKLQSEPFSPPRYANLFRAAQDCVWEWLQTEVYPKFYASSLYVMLVVETEDLEADRQLRRLSEHLQSSAKKSTSTHQERQSETPLKANAVIVPIKQSLWQHLCWNGAQGYRHSFDLVLVVEQLVQCGIHSICVTSVAPPGNSIDQVSFELFCTGDQQEAAAESHPVHSSCWWKSAVTEANDNPLFSFGRHQPTAAPPPSFHDCVLPREDNEAYLSEKAPGRYLFGVCLTQWLQIPTQDKANTLETDTETKEPASGALYYPQFVAVFTEEPMHKKNRRLLVKFVSSGMKNVTEKTISELVAETHATSKDDACHLLNARYGGFMLKPNLRPIDFSLSSAFKEISSQTFISIMASILVDKSIILVSERSAALISVGEAVRELLKPFEWTHLYLPYCPVATVSELRDTGVFSEAHMSPFFICCEGTVSFLKKDVGIEQRFRIRNLFLSTKFPLDSWQLTTTLVFEQFSGNSLYTTHKVSLHVQATATSREYPPELLQTQAIIIDIDSDDIYVPEKVDIPEFPRELQMLYFNARSYTALMKSYILRLWTDSILRSLESALNTALNDSRMGQADSHLFNTSKTPDFIGKILQPGEPIEDITPAQHEQAALSLDDRARLTLLYFLEALFGDVMYYFCSFHQNFAVEAESTSADADEFLLFEIDLFLDDHAELGCRDFFRQCFHTQLFRDFMLAQHMQFSVTSINAPLESRKVAEMQQESELDSFI